MAKKFTFLSLLSGVLLSLPWLGFGGFTLFFAFVPLFYINHYLLERKQAYVPMYFSIFAFISFFVWNLLSTWWLAHATFGGAAFAIIVNSLLMTVVLTLVHYAYRVQRQGFGNLFFIFAWLSFEFFHYHWELAWPWLNLGMGFANNIRMIQWYEFTGSMGGSAWVLVLNLIVWSLFSKIRNKEAFNPYGLSLGILTFVLPVLVSLFIFTRFAPEVGENLDVVISQPNVDPFTEKFDEASFRNQYQILIEMADSLSDDRVDLFVGPETALHNVWAEHENKHQGIKMIREFLKNYPNAAFVSGAMSLEAYNSKEKESESARFCADSSVCFDAYNAALLIDADGVQNAYRKIKLAAGVERIPYHRYLKIFEQMVVGLGGVTGTLGQGTKTNVFEHQDIKFGVPICSESIFGEYVAGFVNKGAEFLVVITNDGWCKTKPGYDQHFAYSRILAIEHRRDIVRAANTGISGFINQKGEIIQKGPWWEVSALRGEITTNNSLSFYSLHGDFLSRISVFMFVLMLLKIFVGRRTEKV